MKFLLDTNVFREIGKSEPHANVVAWLNTVDDADLTISALTVREVSKGVEKLRAKKHEVGEQIEIRVREVLDAFGNRILPVTREIADLWGKLLAKSDKHVVDLGLVATARLHGLILMTRNLKHVSGFGAAAQDPYKSTSNKRRM